MDTTTDIRLEHTEVRIITCTLDPTDPLDGDPYSAWVHIPAYSRTRAVLLPARAFVDHLARPYSTLRGERFTATLTIPADDAPAVVHQVHDTPQLPWEG